MDTRQISEEYSHIGEDLILTEEALSDIRESQATIVFLSSEYERTKQGRAVHAVCEKVPDKYKWSVPCDFTITVYEPNVERFTPEQMRILLFHELLHVGIQTDGNEESYFVRPHDIEDFREVIERYGMDWDD
jgi:hypothetical protein